MSKLRDAYWTPAEFADQFERSLTSIYEAMKKRKLRFVEIGRMKYIPKQGWQVEPEA
jgi:hypothetical protein